MAYPESDEKLMFLQKQPSYYHIRLYIVLNQYVMAW